MHSMHEFASNPKRIFSRLVPLQARLGAADAPALKPPYETGRRGGESIARQRWWQHLI